MSDTALNNEVHEPAESVGGDSARAPHAGAGTFWACGEGIHALDDPTPFGQENALQKLGKPPFEKTTRSRFRLLGYLATMYEHVSQDVARAANILLPHPNAAVPEVDRDVTNAADSES